MVQRTEDSFNQIKITDIIQSVQSICQILFYLDFIIVHKNVYLPFKGKVHLFKAKVPRISVIYSTQYQSFECLVRDFGAIFDNKLTFKEHIEMTIMKVLIAKV